FAKVRFQQFYQPRHALAGAIRRSLHILPQVRHIWQAGMVPGDGKGCWEKVRMVLRGLPEGECSPVDRVVCFRPGLAVLAEVFLELVAILAEVVEQASGFG